MKRKLTILLSLVLSFTLLSCTNESISEFGNSENNITKSDTSAQNIDRVIIVPLEVDIDTLPPMAATMSSNSGSVLSSNLRALKEYPIYLKSTSTGRYMRSTGTGVETILDYKNDWHSYEYVIRTFASSTGIPYMIYSRQTGTALTVGTNPNDPNAKVVYAREGDPSTGFEMSVWDIFPATNSQGVTKDNGAVVIESKFYLGNGPGGGPYGDIFNYVINAVSNSQLRYARYANQASQEFIIEPVGKFSINNVVFDPNNIKITKKQGAKMTKEYTNIFSYSDIHDFEFKNTAANFSLFHEKNGIKFDKTDTANIIRPILSSNNDLILYPKLEESKLVSYGGLDFYSKTVEIVHPVWIEPNQKIVCDMTIDTYNIEVGYVATAKSSIDNSVVVKIVGTWKATLTGEQGVLTETITNTRTKSVTTKVTPINSSMIKNVYYEK